MIEFLGSVGRSASPVVVPRLVEIVRDGERFDKKSALESLGRIGPAAEEAIPVMVENLEEFPRVVPFALAKIGRRADLVVPTLMRAFRTTDCPDVIAYALGEFGPQARTSVQLLVSDYEKFANVESGGVYRLYYIVAIAQIAVPKKRVRAVLLKVMSEDGHSAVRAAAATGLGKMEPLDEDVLLGLSKALKDDDPYPRIAAAATLAKRNHGGENPAHVLAKALDEELSDRTTPINTIHYRILDTIKRMGNLGPKIRPALPNGTKFASSFR